MKNDETVFIGERDGGCCGRHVEPMDSAILQLVVSGWAAVYRHRRRRVLFCNLKLMHYQRST